MKENNTYETIIGLEVHVQLSTKSKAYCADPNLFGENPNTCVSPISAGYPGTLPKINKEVIKSAIKLGLRQSLIEQAPLPIVLYISVISPIEGKNQSV